MEAKKGARKCKDTVFAPFSWVFEMKEEDVKQLVAFIAGVECIPMEGGFGGGMRGSVSFQDIESGLGYTMTYRMLHVDERNSYVLLYNISIERAEQYDKDEDAESAEEIVRLLKQLSSRCEDSAKSLRECIRFRRSSLLREVYHALAAIDYAHEDVMRLAKDMKDRGEEKDSGN